MRQILIFGRRQQGKSTLAFALARSLKERTIIFDPNAQFSSFSAIDNYDDLIEALVAEQDVIRYAPLSSRPSEEWPDFADIVWQFRDYALIIDECSVIQSASYMDDKLERFLRRAPDDVVIIQTTHRPVDTNKLSRQLATDIFCFQTRMKADLEMMRSDFSPDMPEALQRLSEYNVLHYWGGRGGSYEHVIWNNPEDWYGRIGHTERNSRACGCSNRSSSLESATA